MRLTHTIVLYPDFKFPWDYFRFVKGSLDTSNELFEAFPCLTAVMKER